MSLVVYDLTDDQLWYKMFIKTMTDNRFLYSHVQVMMKNVWTCYPLIHASLLSRRLQKIVETRALQENVVPHAAFSAPRQLNFS